MPYQIHYRCVSDTFDTIGTHTVKAYCFRCGRRQYTMREDCWQENGHFVTDDLCSEYPEGEAPQNHEW